MSNVIEHQRVIDSATRLFGELGYDGTPLRLIAEALGVSPSAVVEVAGDKRTIYVEVMRQAYEAERQMLDEAVSRAGTGRAAVHEIVDGYLDFHVANPQNRALWAHRWVDDATDLSELEDRYARPLFRLVAQKIRHVVPPDVDTYYLLGTLVWCVHGFLGSGLLDRSRGIRRADGRAAVGPSDAPRAVEQARAQEAVHAPDQRSEQIVGVDVGRNDVPDLLGDEPEEGPRVAVLKLGEIGGVVHPAVRPQRTVLGIRHMEVEVAVHDLVNGRPPGAGTRHRLVQHLPFRLVRLAHDLDVDGALVPGDLDDRGRAHPQGLGDQPQGCAVIAELPEQPGGAVDDTLMFDDVRHPATLFA